MINTVLPLSMYTINSTENVFHLNKHFFLFFYKLLCVILWHRRMFRVTIHCFGLYRIFFIYDSLFWVISYIFYFASDSNSSRHKLYKLHHWNIVHKKQNNKIFDWFVIHFLKHWCVSKFPGLSLLMRTDLHSLN